MAFFVVSIADQRLRQTLPFYGCQFVGHHDGVALAASQNSVYRLAPVPLTDQIKVIISLLIRVIERLRLCLTPDELRMPWFWQKVLEKA